MTDDQLKKLFDTLDDEETAALLDGLSVPKDTAARIAARVEEKRIAAQMPAARSRRPVMRWIFPAAASIAVLLCTAAAFYLGRRTSIDPVFSSETSAALPEVTAAPPDGSTAEPVQEPTETVTSPQTAAGTGTSTQTRPTETRSSPVGVQSTVITTARIESSVQSSTPPPLQTTLSVQTPPFTRGTTTALSVIASVSTPPQTQRPPSTTKWAGDVTTVPDPWWSTTSETTTTPPEDLS